MEEHTAAEGDGPVNALDGALRSALVKSFRSIGKGLEKSGRKRENFEIQVGTQVDVTTVKGTTTQAMASAPESLTAAKRGGAYRTSPLATTTASRS